MRNDDRVRTRAIAKNNVRLNCGRAAENEVQLEFESNRETVEDRFIAPHRYVEVTPTEIRHPVEYLVQFSSRNAVSTRKAVKRLRGMLFCASAARCGENPRSQINKCGEGDSSQTTRGLCHTRGNMVQPKPLPIADCQLPIESVMQAVPSRGSAWADRVTLKPRVIQAVPPRGSAWADRVTLKSRVTQAVPSRGSTWADRVTLKSRVTLAVPPREA